LVAIVFDRLFEFIVFSTTEKTVFIEYLEAFEREIE